MLIFVFGMVEFWLIFIDGLIELLAVNCMLSVVVRDFIVDELFFGGETLMSFF